MQTDALAGQILPDVVETWKKAWKDLPKGVYEVGSYMMFPLDGEDDEA